MLYTVLYLYIYIYMSVFKEGSVRGEIARRLPRVSKRTQHHPLFGISPKTTLVLSLTSIDSREKPCCDR